jgi:RimJ/RimL family protein N-acetyltransferase
MTFDLPIPVLETHRLRLRALSANDLPDDVAFFATEASRFVGGPRSRIEVWKHLAAMIGHWVLRGYGFWSVEDRKTGTYCGRVGLFNPEGWPEPEIGWSLMAAATGKGYATEAAAAARAHAYGTLGWTTAISLIAPDNRASKAVARRLGASFERDFDHASLGRMEIWRHLTPAALSGGQTP